MFKVWILFALVLLHATCVWTEADDGLDIATYSDSKDIPMVSISNSESLEDTKLSRFMSWLTKCGASFGPVIIKNVTYEGYSQYGVFVDGEVEEFAEVARIPMTCIISYQTAIEHSTLTQVWEKHPELTSGRSPLAIQLLWERHLGSASPLFEWIEMLPKEVDLPMMWTREERQELRGSYTLDRTLADIDGLVEDYDKHFTRSLFLSFPEIFDEDKFPLEDYLWAWSILWSRNIEQRLAGTWEVFLTPWADMINHHPSSGADVYVNFAKTHMVVRVNGSVANGQELTRCYIRQGPNVDFFRMFGFIEARNDLIASALKFSMDKTDKYFNRRVQWAKKYKLDIGAEYPYNNLLFSNQGIPPHIPAILRIAQYQFEGRESWTTLRDAPDPFKAIDNRVEERFFSFLRDNLKKRMQEYPTTVAEDEELLEQIDLPRRLRLAIEMRLEEKVAILGAIESLAIKTVKFDEPIDFSERKAPSYPKRSKARSGW